MRFRSILLLVLLAAPAANAMTEHADVGYSPSFVLFPGHDEVSAAMAESARSDWIELVTVGASGENRPLQVAVVSDPNDTSPPASRAVTLLLTQQHGNEPAGTPAALDLLARIAAGDPVRDFVAGQTVIVLPLVNPDGAAQNRRANFEGQDINRDHIGLESPEAQAVRSILSSWDVHVAMDHHEYSGLGTGNPNPVRAYDYDLTTLFPVHENVREPTRQAAKSLMYDGVWPAAEAAGYSANEYGEQTVAGVPVNQAAGGPDPGILRNAMGLNHVAGILVETRIDAYDNPFQDAARRTAIHANVMEATLAYVQANAAGVMEAKRLAEALETRDPATMYLESGARGTIPPAFRVSGNDTRQATRLVEMHGIPGMEGNLIPTGHAWRALTAATFHPASSRAAFEVTGAAWTSSTQSLDEEAPGPGLVALLAVAALAAMARRR